MIAANFSPIPISNPNRPSNIHLPSSFISQSKKFNGFLLFQVDRAEMGRVKSFGVNCFKGRFTSEYFRVDAENGGVDLLSTSAKPYPDHLIIMVNGLVGSSSDWRYAAEQFVKRVPDKVIVHRSECNGSKSTFDGVDLMGERLAAEVLAIVRRRPELKKISFVAHSLGGLISRYAIGRLYEHSPEDSPTDLPIVASSPRFVTPEVHSNDSRQSHEHPCKARIAGLEPMNYVTFATPHLGSRGHQQLPILCGLPFLERRARQTAHLVAGRTGKHLFLNDHDDGKPPLLIQMVHDSDNLKFISALRAFKRRVAYANVSFDYMVGWRTSSIRRQHELPLKSNLHIIDEKYPHIVHIEPETVDNTINKSFTAGDQAIDLEEEMIRGLTEVPWQRVDVSFQKSRQRHIAHSTIQVKSYWLNSDGTDVVFHMIDNFLL